MMEKKTKNNPDDNVLNATGPGETVEQVEFKMDKNSAVIRRSEFRSFQRLKRKLPFP